MNWRLAFVAVPALCAAPALAFAQGSVTLYGNRRCGHRLHEQRRRPQRVADGKRLRARQPLGLKGTEDPGGGYSALFQLENGFNVNNGTLAQGGRMFGRQAYVEPAARGSAR